MNYLHLYASETSPRSACVRWSVGIKNRGVLSVQFAEHTPDLEAAAELAAIRYLLAQKQVTGTEISTGKGMLIEVSKGAVRKLWLGKSSKRHLTKYASFLRTQLAAAEVRVAKSPHETIPSEDAPVTDTLIVSPMRYEYVDTPHGRIYITDHALERYKERMHQGYEEKAFASLCNRLKHPALRPVELPSSVLKHKLKKHGHVPFAVLSMTNCVDHFVVAQHPTFGLVLVTVFDRKVDEYRFLPSDYLDEIREQASVEEIA